MVMTPGRMPRFVQMDMHVAQTGRQHCLEDGDRPRQRQHKGGSVAYPPGTGQIAAGDDREAARLYFQVPVVGPCCAKLTTPFSYSISTAHIVQADGRYR